MTAPSASGAFKVDHHISSAAELLRRNRVADAREELESALLLDPESVRALALYGLALFRSGAFAEARPVYEKLVKAAPDDAAYHLNLGLVRLKLSDADGAVTALERSRDLDPSQGRAVNYLGLAYARGGRFTDAYRAFLVAGQVDLAREISDNLTPADRAEIEASLRRPATTSATPPRADLPAPVAAGDGDGELELVIEAEADSEPSPTESARFVVGELVERTAAAPVAALGAQPAPSPVVPSPVVPSPVVSSPVVSSPVVPSPVVSSPVVSSPVPAVAAPAVRTMAESSPALILDNLGAISRAVADAAPSAAAVPAPRASTGGRGLQPLSELATARLVRPEDGDEPFELSAGGFLIVRVNGKMYSRTEGVDVTGGSLTYEPARRRARGQTRPEPFATAGRPMFQVTGSGHLIAAPLGGQFTAVALDEDILYLREDLLFAFVPDLRWENGHVPGSRATIPMVQFRGSGAVAFRTQRPLLTVKLAADKVLYVDAAALAGWIGRVVPRAVTAADAAGGSELFVECTGEGVVLVEEPPPLS